MARFHRKAGFAVAMLGGMLAILAGGCAMFERTDTSSRPLSIPTNQTRPLALSGAQEVPSVTTAALGTGSFEITPGRSITGGIATTGVIAISAQIHEGPAGKNGPEIVLLTKTGDNTWSVAANTSLTDTQYLSYLAGNLYVNVHSPTHPDGEIRAQLKP